MNPYHHSEGVVTEAASETLTTFHENAAYRLLAGVRPFYKNPQDVNIPALRQAYLQCFQTTQEIENFLSHAEHPNAIMALGKAKGNLAREWIDAIASQLFFANKRRLPSARPLGHLPENDPFQGVEYMSNVGSARPKCQLISTDSGSFFLNHLIVPLNNNDFIGECLYFVASTHPSMGGVWSDEAIKHTLHSVFLSQIELSPHQEIRIFFHELPEFGGTRKMAPEKIFLAYETMYAEDNDDPLLPLTRNFQREAAYCPSFIDSGIQECMIENNQEPTSATGVDGYAASVRNEYDGALQQLLNVDTHAYTQTLNNLDLYHTVRIMRNLVREAQTMPQSPFMN